MAQRQLLHVAFSSFSHSRIAVFLRACSSPPSIMGLISTSAATVDAFYQQFIYPADQILLS